MESKEYSIYKIASPNGMCYVGCTSQAVSERWRQHKLCAYNKNSEHPLHKEIRAANPDDFKIEVLHTTSNHQEAMQLEEMEIAKIPKHQSLNLSRGGTKDAVDGGQIFWKRINENPEAKKAYIKKLSETKLSNDWTDYDALVAANLKWRKEHPKEAYKISYRASRIANKRKGYPPPSYVPVETRSLKERLMHKFRLNDVKRQYVTEIWANRSEEEKLMISEKISKSAKQRMAEKTPEERKQITQKARDSIDKTKQSATASEGLKAWWNELRKNPVKYKEYIERRKESRKCRHTT